ncbi:MAG: ribosome maturation factor RimM [Gammaproteobacteria bacterium]|nr:ribosome maturation factor RimM [Gammaproteobacteria bacterium]
MNDQDNELLELGKISGVFGIKGWVKVHSFTDPREGIVEYSPWQIQQNGQWREIAVLDGKPQGKTVIARLDGVDDCDQAMLLIGARIAIHPDQLKSLAKDEYYWRDLVGLRVINTEGVYLGTVEQMMETGANDVMLVRSDRQRLIPFTQGHAVVKVDLEAGEITVEWDADF